MKNNNKNNKKNKNQGSTWISKILNSVIIVLTLIFLINAGALVSTVAEEARGYGYNESTLLYQLEEGDYASLLDMMYTNESYDRNVTEMMEQCYAVARYFEAASYAVAYEGDGQMEKAESYKKVMEEQEGRMGEFAYAAAEIDRLLRRAKEEDK